MIVNSLCNSFTVTSVPHPALYSHAPHFNATTSGILFIIPILITSDDFFFFTKEAGLVYFFFFCSLARFSHALARHERRSFSVPLHRQV